jgi:hypothetical protein
VSQIKHIPLNLFFKKLIDVNLRQPHPINIKLQFVNAKETFTEYFRTTSILDLKGDPNAPLAIIKQEQLRGTCQG